MALIRLRGMDGFTAMVDLDKITSFGISPASALQLWVMADGKEITVSVDVDEQFDKLCEIFKRLNGSKSIPGIKKCEGGGNGDTSQG
jgi:uncharacterized protein YlzI (FlbEa/FlbD family)